MLLYEEGTERSEKSVYKIQPPGNYPEENTQQSVYLLVYWKYQLEGDY